jgi:hypothetical protein
MYGAVIEASLSSCSVISQTFSFRFKKKLKKLLLLFSFQSALTGESLPVTKHAGDGVYSGSTCKQGEIEAVVIATGVHTFFGKAAHLVENTTHVGHFQKVCFRYLFALVSYDKLFRRIKSVREFFSGFLISNYHLD